MKLIASNNWTYIEGTHPPLLNPITSYDVPGAWFSSKYKAGFWDGKVHFIKYDRSRKQYRFPSGFLTRVTTALDAADYPYTLEDDRVFDPPEPQLSLFDDQGKKTIDLSSGKWSYQADIVRSVLSHGRGIVSMPTGGGKTEVGAAIIQSLGKQTCWLTHRKNLMYQTHKRLTSRLGQKIGMVGDGHLDIQPVTVVMVQTAASREKEGYEQLLAYLQGCECVIGDEIHHLESDQWFDFFASLDAPWRIGLTATPSLTGPGLALVGMVGDIIAKIDLLELIERRVLVIPRIWFAVCEEPKLPAKLPWQTAYSQGVVSNKARNELICRIAQVFKTECKPTITLVKRKNHGSLLTDMMNYQGIRAEFIQGEVKQGERDELLGRLEEGRIHNIVAIAETMGEGTDIPFLRALINATGSRGGGNAQEGDTGRQTLQFLGRILRSHKNKAYCDYVDIADRHQKALASASHDRVSTLEAQGYSPFVKYWHHYQIES